MAGIGGVTGPDFEVAPVPGFGGGTEGAGLSINGACGLLGEEWESCGKQYGGSDEHRGGGFAGFDRFASMCPRVPPGLEWFLADPKPS